MAVYFSIKKPHTRHRVCGPNVFYEKIQTVMPFYYSAAGRAGVSGVCAVESGSSGCATWVVSGSFTGCCDTDWSLIAANAIDPDTITAAIANTNVFITVNFYLLNFCCFVVL